MGAATVGAGFAHGLLELAISRGAERSQLAARAGLAPQDLEDPDGRIPFANYVALMRVAKEMTGDAALALHFGEAANLAQYSILGLIGQAASTLAEAWGQLQRYVRLVVDVDLATERDRFEIDAGPNGTWLVDTRANPNAFPELTESAFAQMVCSIRRLGLADWARAVHVTHAAPAHRAEYARIFQVPVTFGAARNALRLNPAAGEFPQARLPRYAFGILSDRAETLLQSLDRSTSTRARVERLLIAVLHTGEAGVARVAAQLGMSRQTLYRRLKAEGSTFETVLDGLRHQMALHYLSDGKVSVNETAYLVGFSEPAAFSRAFKRWTGASPRSMRAGGAAKLA